MRRSTRTRSSKRVAADEAKPSATKRVPTEPSATKRVPAKPSATKRVPTEPSATKRVPADPTSIMSVPPEPRLKLRAALLRQINAPEEKKPKTAEELLARGREYKRRRRERIMADPALYAQIRAKDRERREELRRIKIMKRKAEKERLEAVDDDLFVVIVGDEDDANRRKQVIAVKKEEVVDEDEQFENILQTAEKHGMIIPIDAIKQEPNDEYLEAEFVGNAEGGYLSTEYTEVEYLPESNMEGYLPGDTEEKYLPHTDEKEHFLDNNEEYSPDDNDGEYMPDDSDGEYLPDDGDEEYVPDDNDAEYSPDEEYLSDEKEEKLLYCEETETLQPKKHFESAADKEKHRYKMLPPDEQRSFVKELCENYQELAEDKELLIETLAEIMVQMRPPDPPQDYFVMHNIDFQCVTCGAIKDTMPAMERHWQEKHGPRYLVCYACGVDFRSKTNLYKHEKRCNAADAVVVLQARARFVGRKGRSRPFLLPPAAAALRLKVRRGKNKHHCPQCPAEYVTKQALQSHMFAHQGARPYQCHECAQAYTSRTALSRHRHAKHSGLEFICDHCSRSFCSKSSLIQHLNTHEPMRRFACDLCGSRFAQRLAMELHKRRVHYNLPPPCACQICPKRYPRMSLLKVHMRKAHGMNLITKNMFYKALPHLSDSQIQQAKIVMKPNSQKTLVQQTCSLTDFLLNQSDTASQRNENISEEPDLDETTVHNMPGTAENMLEMEENMPEMEDDNPQIESQYKVQDEVPSDAEPTPETVDEEHIETDLSSEMLDYMKRFQEGKLNDKTLMIIIQDGKVTCIDDSNKHLYKEHLHYIQDQSTEEDKEERVIQSQIDEEEQRPKKKRVRFRNGPW